MVCKNCSPTIKLNTITYIANYIIDNDDDNYTNNNYFSILDNYLSTCNYNQKIKDKLKLYIKKNPELIINKIQKIKDETSALELNSKYCDICHIYCNDRLELQKHYKTIEHITHHNILLKNKLDNVNKEFIKYKGLYHNKCKTYDKLYFEYCELKENYTKLELITI
jgi:hypothetical protein